MEDQERKNEKRNLNSTKRGVDVRFLSLGDSVIFIILLFFYFYHFHSILLFLFIFLYHFGFLVFPLRAFWV